MRSYVASFFGYISKYSILATILLVPIFALPLIPVSFLHAKIGLCIFLVTISFIAYIAECIETKKIYIPSISYTIFAKWVVGFGLLSAVCSVIPEVSWIGSGVDLDTLYFTAICIVAGYMAAVHLRDIKAVVMTLGLFTSVATIVALFHVARFVFGSDLLSFGIFNTFSSNTLGSLADLSIYSSLALLTAILLLETVSNLKYINWILYFQVGVLSVITIITNFNIVSNLGLINVSIPISLCIALFLFIIAIYIFRHKRKLSYISLALGVVFTLVSVWGAPIRTYVISQTGMSAQETLDIRVTPTASVDIIRNAYTENIKTALIGSGQSTYFTLWAKYKDIELPNSVNITPFWNYDFNSGFSYLSTVAATSGVSALSGWLLGIGLLCYLFFRKKKGNGSVGVGLTFFPAAYTLCVICLYTPGASIVLLTLIFTGIVFAQYASLPDKPRIYNAYTLDFGNRSTSTVVLINTLLVCTIAVSVYSAGSWVVKTISAHKADEALAWAEQGAAYIEDAEVAILRAIEFNPSNVYLRFYSELTLLRPGLLVANTEEDTGSNPVEETRAKDDLSKSIKAAETAVYGEGVSNDYRDWIQLGRVYEIATFLGSTTTAPLTIRSYAKAEDLAPTNPIPPYLVARILYFAKENEEALEQVRLSLRLKPDYEPALGLFRVLTRATTTGTVVPQSKVRGQ